MRHDAPNHFSHKLCLKLDNLPAKTSDRIALNILYPGILFGALLALLGIYEFFNIPALSGKGVFDGFMSEEEAKKVTTLINPTFFDAVLTVLGLWIVTKLIMSYVRYKKIRFDGKVFDITYRPAMGEKVSFCERLENYKGVRFRVEFLQFGILNKNRYIIELLHKTPEKTIPLYISTSDKDVRKIWEYYAKTLKMPAVMTTAAGEIYRSIEDLDKPLRQMVAEGLIKDEFDPKKTRPKTIACAYKKDKIVVKGRKIVWDAFNWLFIICGGALLTATLFNYERIVSASSQKSAFVLMSALALFVIAAVFVLFRKDKLVIKKDKVVHVHKFMLFSRKNDELKKDDIEEINVTLNPVTGRYCVSVISDDKNIIFGKKLPIDDLRWVKQFLIHQIVANS